MESFLAYYETSWDRETDIFLGKLEEIYRTLKAREAIYETHLKCRLHYEQHDIYKFAFLNNDSSVTGWIRFKHDQSKNKWTVLEIEPSNVVPDTVLNKFYKLQDTQGFLCYFRTHI